MSCPVPDYQELIEQNHNLIWEYLHRNHLSEDYYGDAAIGLCKAAKYYDSSKGAFSTLAFKCMSNECRGAIRNNINASKIKTISLESSVCDFDDGSLTIEQTLSDNKFASDDIAFCEFIRWFIEMLDNRFLVIILRRLNGDTYDSIGKEFNLTRERIRQYLVKMQKAYKRKSRLIMNDYDTEECEDLRNQIIGCLMSSYI